MEETTRVEWEALKKQFDDQIDAAGKEFVETINKLDDDFRKRNEEREDRKYSFLTELKKEHRVDASEYIKATRQAKEDLRAFKTKLERERQAAYSKFKYQHRNEEIVFDYGKRN